MDNTLAKLIRAARGPVLLMTLGALLAIHQFSGVSFQLCLHFRPLDSLMTAHISLEAGLQCLEQLFAFFW